MKISEIINLLSEVNNMNYFIYMMHKQPSCHQEKLQKLVGNKPKIITLKCL